MIKKFLIVVFLIFAESVCAQLKPAEQPRPIEQPLPRPSRIPDRNSRSEARIPRRNVYVTPYQPSDVEKKLLTPASEDAQNFAEFLRQPNTGLIRIFPARPSRVVSVDQLESGQGPGFIKFASLYSFTKAKHGNALEGYVDPRLGWAELKFDQGTFVTGITGNCLGVLVSLGDVALQNVTTATPAAAAIAEFRPPVDYLEEHRFVQVARAGFTFKGMEYKATLPVALNTTYTLRSISNKRADLLVAFRVVREHEDGSVTLLWKKLKINPKPSWKKQPE
jgi:hypothetical protein